MKHTIIYAFEKEFGKIQARLDTIHNYRAFYWDENHLTLEECDPNLAEEEKKIIRDLERSLRLVQKIASSL